MKVGRLFMIISIEMYATESDGGKWKDYCKYCYENRKNDLRGVA
ncbi:zinc ribbon domain-containing protein [Fusibacter ferrireducens]|uniref:Putative zinc ribbon domain-containing protein n=1 Tax=Fusibacter ferrireducens TaxID=2785058 RepID=A0ABR9ZVC5_9FIRM|nr:zinc ribbon domain-containing protein [Fusibacter ferrireducens]MBF4694311.1 hypothetical protein [Fusibacter ferrireducens]